MEEFKLIVAGGRDFRRYQSVADEIISLADGELADYNVSIVSGMANGADRMAWQFAKHHGIQVYEFPADWDNLDVPGAVIKHTRSGKAYNAAAGHIRNRAMAEFADGLLAFHDGQSRGTANMIQTMKSLGKPVRDIRY